MNKTEFLAAIAEKLGALSKSDIENSLAYYSEMVEDYMENGKTEEEAVAAIGTPEEIAAQILMEQPLPKIVKAKVKKSRKMQAWEVVLIVLGAPIWASLLLAAAIMIFSLYIVIWALAVVLYAVDISFAAVALAGIWVCVLSAAMGNAAQAIFFAGIFFFFIGAATLMFFGSNAAAKGMAKLSVLIMRGIKHIFTGKAEAK